MSETYCAPTPLADGSMAAPVAKPTANAATMAAPGALTPVSAAAFPTPCEPDEE